MAGQEERVDVRRLTFSLTALGAIALWSSTVGVSRLLTEPLGPMTAGAAAYLAAGGVGVIVLLAHRGTRQRLRHLTGRYVLGCGGLFVAYLVCLCGAIGLARGRGQVYEVLVINYLWPGLTLAFSVPLRGNRLRPMLPVGILLAFAGVALAGWRNGSPSPEAFLRSARSVGWPHLLALGGAVTWAIYSNLSRRWAGPAGSAGVPLFILASGAIMAGLAPLMGERPAWDAALAGPLAFLALGPGLAAYLLWDLAVRRGSVAFAATAAYATPILSALVAWGLLKEPPPPCFWPGCAMIVAGAALCRLGVREAVSD